MKVAENPGIVVSKSAPLRERVNSKDYPSHKVTEGVPVKKINGKNKTSESNRGSLLSKDGPKNITYKPKIRLKVNKTALGFVYDRVAKKAIMLLVDKKTGKVILQVPPKEVIAKVKEDLRRDIPAGVVIDKRV
jgi:uncharacterized FlaG/YvyC family protein